MVMFSDQYDDIYFSQDDGMAETRHVFLDGCGLSDQWPHAKHTTIAETGFGTGLNILMAWALFETNALPDQTLDLISFEKHPLHHDDIRSALQRWSDHLGDLTAQLCDKLPLRIEGVHPVWLNERVRLTLVYGDINDTIPQIKAQVDYWFLDGFTPAKNPDMWSETVFSQMARLSHDQTKLATFTAAGIVKQGLIKAGFEIEKRPGFGRKRDMLIGRFTTGTKGSPTKPEKIIIIGGGLAGLTLHHKAQQQGLQSRLYESGPSTGHGASGNSYGMINPKLTAIRTVHSDYYSAAYAHALAFYRQFNDVDFNHCGNIQLNSNADKQRRFDGYCQSLGWHNDHITQLSCEETSKNLGYSIDYKSLYYPDAACASPQKICTELQDRHVYLNHHINAVKYENGLWRLLDCQGKLIDEAAVLILAAGHDVVRLLGDAAPPLSKTRGQTSHVTLSPAPLTSLCYGGYATPPSRHGHSMLGATFQPWDDMQKPRIEDDQDNAAKLAQYCPNINVTHHGSWVGFRTSSKDRFPYVGAMGEVDGLYLSTAHGSHGMISAPYAAEIILSQIQKTTLPCTESVLRALSPTRF